VLAGTCNFFIKFKFSLKIDISGKAMAFRPVRPMRLAVLVVAASAMIAAMSEASYGE